MIKIKDNIDVKELKRFGFQPLYDEHTGELNIHEMVKSCKYKIQELQQENQQLKEQLEKERKTRKEAIELIKEKQRKDEFLELNEWQTRDLIKILDIDKGE